MEKSNPAYGSNRGIWQIQMTLKANDWEDSPLEVITNWLVVLILAADHTLISPNLSMIANEFEFDSLERDVRLGGRVALAFFLVGARASLWVRCLT